MSNTTDDRDTWQAVIDAHPLESHDLKEWLRYGVALLQTIEPGPNVGKQLQQAALAFLQAQKEGATTEQVASTQRQSVVISLRKAISLAGMCTDSQNQDPEIQGQVTHNNSTPLEDGSFSRLIQILVDLYSLQPPHDADTDHRSQLLALKQQLRERGIAIRGVQLALMHARQAESNLSNDSIEEVLRFLS